MNFDENENEAYFAQHDCFFQDHVSEGTIKKLQKLHVKHAREKEVDSRMSVPFCSHCCLFFFGIFSFLGCTFLALFCMLGVLSFYFEKLLE